MSGTQSTVTKLVKQQATAERGMVATKDKLATQAGVTMLEAGGNAIDAAVAACLAIGVVEPASNSIGGGGYLVYQVGQQGGVIGFPMRGPLAAKPDMYQMTGRPAVGSFGWAEVVDNENLEGYRSIATPGCVAGLYEAHKRFGKLPLKDVVAPAVKLAREGFVANWFNIYAIGMQSDKLFKYGELRRIFMPQGDTALGDLINPHKIVQPELADILEAIGREGADAFYRGDVAKTIVDDVQANGGVLSLDDFAQYKPFVWDDGGLEFSYSGHTVRVPPFACAGTTSAMTLKLLDGFNVREMGHNSADMLHAYISSARLAYADRFEYMADPEFADVPWNGMLSDAYTERRRAGITDNAPSVFEAGDPWKEEGREPEMVLASSRPAIDNGTTHLTVMDGDGNAVSLTNTVMAGFGSGIVPKGSGVVMNNGMMWYDPIPGRVNSIMPGKFPLNNMTPALVLDDKGVKMAVGASGGRRITNCVTQQIVKVIDFGMGPQEAIDSARVDCSNPVTSVDPRLDESVKRELEARGHKLNEIAESFMESGFGSFASPVAIVRNDEGGFDAGVDTFQSAHAAGI